MFTHKHSPAHLFLAGMIVAVMGFSLAGSFKILHAVELSETEGSSGTTGGTSYPAQSVCGDAVLDVGEQCDDGNLVNGDSCSNACLLEGCGNGVVDTDEQCDDKNTRNGDGCSAQCFIEFCGDGIVQELSGEACDDGNTTGNDGCTAKCAVETLPDYCPYDNAMNRNLKKAYEYFMIITGKQQRLVSQNIAHDWTAKDIAFLKEILFNVWELQKPILCNDYKYVVSLLNRTSVTVINVETPVVVPVDVDVELEVDTPADADAETDTDGDRTTGRNPPGNQSGETRRTREKQIKKVTEFLSSSTGKGIYDRLDPETQQRLDEILRRYRQGRGLSQEELAWIASLAEKIMLANNAEKQLYTDLLKKFTWTDISRDVLGSNQILRERLIDEIPIAIEELEKAVAIIERGELRQEVARAIARLQRQQLTVAHRDLVGSSSFDEAARPVEAFSAIVMLKDDVESQATPSIPRSAAVIAVETAKIRETLPYLAETHRIDTEEILTLLDLVDVRSHTVDVNSAERYVATINRLTAELSRSGIRQITDPQAFALVTTDTLSRADRIAATYGHRSLVASFIPTETPASSLARLDPITAYAPEIHRPAFVTGTAEEQRDALVSYLTQNERVQSLRSMLPERHHDQYDALLSDISRIGTDDSASAACDDSVQAGIDCIDAYMFSLQDAVRSRSVWTRIVGSVQDIFGL